MQGTNSVPKPIPTSRVRVTSPVFHALLLKESSTRGDVEAAEEAFGLLLSSQSIAHIGAKEWTMLVGAYGRVGDIAGVRRVLVFFESSNTSLYHECRGSCLVFLSVVLSGFKQYLADHAVSLPADEKDACVEEALALYTTAEGLSAFKGNAHVFVTAMVGVYCAAGRRSDATTLVAHASNAFGLTSPRELNFKALSRCA